ncbi:15433_t:CDS:10, partial [Dentiscutata erythropus]
AHLYEAKGSNWTCLDGSSIIPYEAINDDFCDCADGSDEPGTSACPNGKFYCKNVGHIPSYILSSRVNDGPECCDGSDEYDGKIKCPNICKETNAVYRKKLEELEKLRTQGIRIRKKYIEDVKEREAALKKVENDKTDTEQLRPKGNRERIKKYQGRVSALKENINRLHEQIDALLSILKDMKNNHNQNYHDMAVKTAIKAYDEFLEEYNKDTETEDGVEIEEDNDDNYDEIPYEKEKPQIQEPKPSYQGRFLEMLWGIKEGVLELFGLQDYKSNRHYSSSSSHSTSKGTSKAVRDAFEEAEQEQKDIESHIDEIKFQLSQDYGLEYEFATLDNECFNYDSGEYTYSLCMFGSATQKSNKDHTSTDLGNFAKWIGAESNDDPRYYARMLYDNGARCWNGPARSIKLYLECGAENKILSVSEPAKCEYHMRMTTPALCLEHDNHSIDHGHEEL